MNGMNARIHDVDDLAISKKGIGTTRREGHLRESVHDAVISTGKQIVQPAIIARATV